MNVRLMYPMRFNAGVYYNGAMKMNSYVAKLWMITNTTDGESHNTAFERMRHFVHNVIDSSIFINANDREVCQRWADSGINITTLPNEPIDQIVGIMLYCKLNAIMEDRIIIGEIEISSELGDGVVYLHSGEENQGEFDEAGWWNNSDTINYHPEFYENDNVMTVERNAVWRELGLDWPDEIVNEEDSGNTIVFADFNRNDSK